MTPPPEAAGLRAGRGAATWWESLQHYGLLLGPSQQAAIGRRELPDLPFYRVDQLRRELNRFEAQDLKPGELVAWILEKVCRLGGDGKGTWQRGSDVSSEWSRTLVTGEPLRPQHLWTGPQLAHLPVFFDRRSDRLGMFRGRKTVSDCIQWLRAARPRGEAARCPPLALLTNGREWRLLYAGLDYDAACQWHVDRWFEAGEPGPQLEALRRLLSPELLAPEKPGETPPLEAAIQESRRGQAELSAELGERVRQAVEELVRCHGPALYAADLDATDAEIYRAAVRVVMRLVILLFAESRGLLPVDDPVYADGYGLRGLFEQLDRQAAVRRGEVLRHRDSAWPRILALFRLVHDGCHHEALPVPAYGGELFRPGEDGDSDPVRRALHLFETACFDRDHELLVPDAAVHRILKLLSRTKVRIRQGRSSSSTVVPVDFSDLSSEYIGILYEGLLDYELRRAGDDPVLFLSVGNEPALPLSRLEAMDDKQIKDLFETLRDTSSADEVEEAEEELVEEEGEEEEDHDENREAEDGEEAEDADEGVEAEEDEEVPAREEAPYEEARARAEAWTRNAAETAGLVRKPKGKLTPEKKLDWERHLTAKAKAMARRVVLPGEWYLVRWGGTRKGSGTFYTRPQLAVPLVQRTLRPLAYDPPRGDDGEPDRDAPDHDNRAERWTPKLPEEILALKVCDPACGSGTFPLAALRFLTDALHASLFHHGRIRADADRTLVELLGTAGEEAEESLGAERLPCRPDDDAFEGLLKARLRRHVVERCIYGVDLDPLAVELCRLALWIETMDRELPFSFLRHKIKPGNSLVGCWFDRFQHYPALAWKREAGDAGHTNGVHHQKGERTKAIKQFCGNTNIKDPKTVRLDLLHTLEDLPLFSAERQSDAAEVHDEARATLERLHALEIHKTRDRARLYEQEFLASLAWQQLRDAFDLWCACWFWPADELDSAPLPSTFAEPSDETRSRTRELARRHRFFHWELEFPDVFDREGSGFDVVIGNPPWETLQPVSKEFFSNLDPLYRSYGKQQAGKKQTEYFEANPDVEDKWLDYNDSFKCWSTWMSHAAFPWGDPEDEPNGGSRFALARGRQNEDLHRRWRDLRAKATAYADPEHPFRHQGSGKAYTYKLFLDLGHALARKHGRLGFLVPSGLYSDHGTQALRSLFLDRCRWEWLFGFENRDKIFDIHRSYKFNPVIVAKGGTTEAVRTAFMRRRLEDWEDAEEHATPYSRSQVVRFSPDSRAILEIQSKRDLEILDTIYSNSVLLGDKGPDGWGIEYAQGDFNMTSDSKLFPPRPVWEEQGYRPDEYSRWLKGDWQPRTPTSPAPSGAKRVEIPEGIILSRDGQSWIHEQRIDEVALPLYEGRMIGQFDFSQKGWVSGKGRSAVWRELSFPKSGVEPQYLMASAASAERGVGSAYRVVFMDIVSATNERTFFGTTLRRDPCGHSAPTLQPQSGSLPETLGLLASLNSFCCDWLLRQRVSGLHLSFNYLEETALPTKADTASLLAASDLAARLVMVDAAFSGGWLTLTGRDSHRALRARPFHALWGLTPHERRRLRVQLDALVALWYGLEAAELAWILAETDVPTGQHRTLRLNPKGFWRVDKNGDPELRHTVLTLVAFHNLEQEIRDCDGNRTKGIEAFLTQNEGEGWLLPDELRLKDYGLGHDARADRPQPVGRRLGPRFYDWQLDQDPEESWTECELHARNLLGPNGFRDLTDDTDSEPGAQGWRTTAETAEPSTEYPDGKQRLLFSARKGSTDASSQ